MIDLPDHGYTSCQIVPIDPAGVVDGSLGGPSDIIDRPGYRYSIQFTLPQISARDARILQMLLEQGARDDVSYPWPLDQKAMPAGTPLVNGSSAAGATIPIKGLLPGFQFRIGQPLAVILADGTGFIHKATDALSADSSGNATLPVFPLTRATFDDELVVEIERPRIRGVLSWNGAQQGTAGGRSFSFTITERY